MSFIRKIRKASGTYLAEVEGYREDGKVKQRVIKYLGKELDGKPVKRVASDAIKIKSVKRSLDVLSVDKISDELGLKDINNDHVLALVYSQLLEKRSINKLADWLRFTEIPDVLALQGISIKKLYESLSEIEDDEFRNLNEGMLKVFRKYDDFSKAAVIDVTDTYFEGSSLNIKTRRGKEDRVKKLLQIGLAVTFEHGFPILQKQYHGNLSQINILKDMVLTLKGQGFDSIIVDRGMTTPENIDALQKLGYKLISGLKKSASLEESYISKVDREKIYSLANRVKLKNTSVFIQPFKYSDGELIVVYNPEYETLKKSINFEKGKESKPSIGYSLIYHNTKFAAEEIVKKYFEKDIVERAFKKIKGILHLRPIRVWLREHVEGHVRICYLAYAILSLMSYRLRKTGFSAIEALDSLKTGYKVELYDSINKHQWSLTVELEPKQRKILEAIGVVYKN